MLKNDQTETFKTTEEDLSAFNFRKFAATYFTGSNSHQYSKKYLKESLLDLPTPDDTIAAQALWVTILRFMGDLPEPRYENVGKTNETIMSKVTQTLSRSFANRKEYQVKIMFASNAIIVRDLINVIRNAIKRLDLKTV